MKTRKENILLLEYRKFFVECESFIITYFLWQARYGNSLTIAIYFALFQKFPTCINTSRLSINNRCMIFYPSDVTFIYLFYITWGLMVVRSYFERSPVPTTHVCISHVTLGFFDSISDSGTMNSVTLIDRFVGI